MALKNVSNGAITLMLGGATLAVVIVGLVTAFASSQMFGLTSRIDTLYMDSASMKADVARAASATDYMKTDIAEMKGTLKEVSATLQSIDKRLAAADIKGGPQLGNILVKDPVAFAKFLGTEKLPGPIYIQSPDPKTAAILQSFQK